MNLNKNGEYLNNYRSFLGSSFGGFGELFCSDFDFSFNVFLSLSKGQSLLVEFGVLSLRIFLSGSLDELWALSDLSVNLSVKLLNAASTSLGKALIPSLELDVFLLSSF